MIVVDASATTLLFCDPRVEPRAEQARAILADDPAWLVPEHWRVEVCAALRGLDRGGKLGDAARAVRLLRELTVATVPTAELLDRMWQLRASLSTYDAARRGRRGDRTRPGHRGRPPRPVAGAAVPDRADRLIRRPGAADGDPPATPGGQTP